MVNGLVLHHHSKLFTDCVVHPSIHCWQRLLWHIHTFHLTQNQIHIWDLVSGPRIPGDVLYRRLYEGWASPHYVMIVLTVLCESALRVKNQYYAPLSCWRLQLICSLLLFDLCALSINVQWSRTPALCTTPARNVSAVQCWQHALRLVQQAEPSQSRCDGQK